MFIIMRMRNICVCNVNSYNERASTMEEQLQWKNSYNGRVAAAEECSGRTVIQWKIVMARL